MTPSHDGSRTPGQSGAWDPTVTNTPARNNDFDGYSMEDGGSPGYAPGYSATGGPFTPQTPGTMYGSEQSYGPYQPSPSPAGSATASPSPTGYVATPSPSGTGYTASPHGPFATPSPVGYSPMTPGNIYSSKTHQVLFYIYLFIIRILNSRSRGKSIQPPNTWVRTGYRTWIWINGFRVAHY